MANAAGESIRKYLAIYAHFIAINVAVARRRTGDLLSAGSLVLLIPPGHGRPACPDRAQRGRRDPRALCPKHAIGVRWIPEVPQRACVAPMRSRAFLIIAGVLAFPPQASSAPIERSPPLPHPHPAEAPSHPAPNDAAPAEQAKPEPAIDQACLDRLGAAGIEFEAVALPAAKPGCAIETPVRLKAVKLAPQWITSIRLPDEPTFPAVSVNGSVIGCATSSLPSLPASSRSNSSRFAPGRVTNAATAIAPRPARSARTRPVSRPMSRASSSRMAER
jgi:hypothetical protein